MAFVDQLKTLRSRRSPFAIHIDLDRTKEVPLQRQLYDQMRQAILSGRVPAGCPLPSTRSLAIELACARNTVLGAFEQLLAEGYVTGRRGAGTFVANILPEKIPRGSIQIGSSDGSSLSSRLSDIGETIAGIMPNRGERFVSFVPSVPEIGMFPFAVWAQALSSTWANPSQLLATYLDARGWTPLREAIAQHLRSTRMVVGDADQVIITSGAQHSIDMVARLLLNRGDVVWIEDPGYPGTRAALLAAGMHVVPIPLDEHGIDIAAGRDADKPRMIVVAPSHQYPLGCVMSLKRRLELIAFAESNQAFLLEDDYDSEFRFTGEPLASLQGLDAGRRTIYVGTFSKTMFPAVRTGFIVLPERFSEAFSKARAGLDIQPAIVSQPALAAFIREGHLASHVRRMRMVYLRRQQALVAALDKLAQGVLTAEMQETGLHLVARLDRQLGLDDRQASAKAQAGGIAAPPLADYFCDGRATDRLLLGFGTTPESVMDDRVLQLVNSLRR
ncbi:PLP-dependent aminotransferase family protein [Bradyrhizobium septentrionale]|uniref:PLP-dependent aminotransferase family protein n=1 Tax=Bradyrhizobium septentrionale TaxID=1404411 RepID=A0ABZ2P4K0_9BRAD